MLTSRRLAFAVCLTRRSCRRGRIVVSAWPQRIRRIRRRTPAALATVLLASILGGPAAAQGPVGTVSRLRVYGPSLAGNLMGEAADPHVSVYLPPGYDTSPDRRYPVVYLLHGFGATDQTWFGEGGIEAHTAARRAFGSGAAPEMILVMPDCSNAYGGCMFANSATTGFWEDFVSSDLIAWVDGRYRTIARREGRGLAGHAMGGSGALRIAMKHPDVFSAVYALSPCCLAERPAIGDAARRLEGIRSLDELRRQSPAGRAVFARAAAWSPNPGNPPFFLDLPTQDGAARGDVLARWAAHSPAALLDSHVPGLRTLSGIMLDVGEYDQAVSRADIRNLSAALRAYGIPHTFETYDGDHVNRLAQRLETRVLPFFGMTLAGW